MDEFKLLIGQKIERLFVVLWPPQGEENLLQVDLSVGFVFASDQNQLCVLATGDDAWTPCVRSAPLPSRLFPWGAFDTRVRDWMNLVELDVIDTEYYEVTEVDIFKNIVSHAIQSIELVSIQNEELPFGVKIVFEDDFVLITPIAAGSTVETSRFNRQDNLAVFKRLGSIEYRNLQ
jgi:hypothetical protein